MNTVVERSTLSHATDFGGERFFLFISPALHQTNDYLLESIYCVHLEAERAFDDLLQGIVRPDVVILVNLDENYIKIIQLLKNLKVPVVYYTPQYIPASKEIAAKFHVDDYVFGAMNENFVMHMDFLKKLKIRKRKSESRKITLTKFEEMPVAKMWRLKRFFDFTLSLIALIILSPIMTAVAIAIKLESRGPVFYVAKRSGRAFKVFNFYKFRTMRDGADTELVTLEGNNQYDGREGDAVFFKIKNDPRVTKFGLFLRNSSLDELPQLINVLKGDMSLVGNRPLPLYEAEKLTRDQIAWRFLAPAGITGLWQVTKRGKHSMSPEERIQLDIIYARGNSFLYDMKILYLTIPAMFQRERV